MTQISDYAELKILEHSVGKTSWTMPTVYCGLYTAAPSDSGGGTEVSTSGTAYARVATSGLWGTAAAGSITNSSDIAFATATGSGFGTVTHVGLFDASTAGNLLWWGALSASKVVNVGDVFKFLASNLTLTLN